MTKLLNIFYQEMKDNNLFASPTGFTKLNENTRQARPNN